MRYRSASLAVMMLLGLSAGDKVALAHLPIFDDGTEVDAEHALVSLDIRRVSVDSSPNAM
jgi:hypothetical protein